MLIDKINHQNINWFDTRSNIKDKENDDFLNHIKKALIEVSKTQNDAKINSEEYTLNKPNISLNDIMINLEKASISTQIAIQIRNKFVSAYQEIMNQQI